MGKHGKPSQQFLVQSGRRERGIAIPVTTRRITLRDGTAGEELSLSLKDAEVPDRSYFGQECSAKYADDVLLIAFAQPKLGGDLRTLLMISMPTPAAAQFIRSVEKMSDPTLSDIATNVKVQEGSLLEFPAIEPEQTVTLAANIVAVAVSGHETCLDFYHASAFSYLHLRQTKNMYLEPVVRVNTRTSLMLALMRRLKEIAVRFPPHVHVLEGTNDGND